MARVATPADSPGTSHSGARPAARPAVRPGAARPKRSKWRDYPAIFWFVAAFVVTIVHRWVPQATWLMIHMILLGALTHAIFVWSRYFAEALLKVPSDEAERRRHDRRLALVQVGAVLVMAGYPLAVLPLVHVGALLVVVAVVWHGLSLDTMVRRSLAPKFLVTVRYYLLAVGCLMVGVLLGALLATGPAGDWHGRLLTGHMSANLLGWVGMTVAGTLVTFWPTLLRTRMDARAEKLARQAMPVFVVGLVALVLGGVAGWQPVAVAGLVIYAAALIWWGRALIVPLRAKRPREFAAASVLCSMPWFVVGLIWLGVLLVGDDGWAGVSAHVFDVAAVFVVGFALQLLTGAMSYLLPTVLGGGPAAVRANIARFDRWGTFRLVVVNGGLILFLLPTPSWVTVVVSILGAVALALFVPIMMHAILTTVREHRAARAEGAASATASAPGSGAAPAPASVRAERVPEQRSFFSGGQLVAGLVALSLAVTGGIAIDPAAAGVTLAAGSGTTADGEVAATGEEVRIEVSAQAMVFVPSSATVNAGDHVIIELTNDDSSLAHDLTIGGEATPRLVPGEAAEIDLGVVGESMEGWCTIAGHRQMGMTFDLTVEGASDAAVAGVGAAGAASGDSGMAGMDHSSAAMTQQRVTADPQTPIEDVVDPSLAALPTAQGPTTHEIILDMTEEPLEVAPGRWQTRWTYNGGPVGPTLHGRVGDRFVVTLKNSGTMGHSLDFHASWLAPDEPMRTIQPGEELVYDFVAHRAGVWMYHCGTAPVSSHIAAGMTGAVVIEPDEGLPAVDKQFAVVQSEVYMGNEASSPEEAVEVNAQKIADRRPDFVTFNGIANQYQQEPFEVKVGEKVRFFVSNVGPNEPSSFHVIGNQFDTTFFEGGYLLKDGRDPFGTENGGSQALGLQASQGGFVEMTFPEPGDYTVLSHIMSDAELGAIGVVRVTQ